MLDEVAIHRRVTGALPLLEKREEAFRNQYIQALKDVRKLAEGTLAAPESARAVIAEQIADITYVATRERAAKTKVERSGALSFTQKETFVSYDVCTKKIVNQYTNSTIAGGAFFWIFVAVIVLFVVISALFSSDW